MSEYIKSIANGVPYMLIHSDGKVTFRDAAHPHPYVYRLVCDADNVNPILLSWAEIAELKNVPAPKPDPLVEVLKDFGYFGQYDADDFRAALDARGLEIRSKNDG